MIAAPDGRVFVTPTGGPALATGGTGDVLAGVIAATAARADDIALSAARACWWHGRAGDLVAASAGGGSEAVAGALPLAMARDGIAPEWPFA